MKIKSAGNFFTMTSWLMEVGKGQDWVYCYTSALECLGLFIGYVNEAMIDVYAKEKGEFENVNYFIVDSFDHLEIETYENIRYTSLNQTINDMLADFDNIDEQSFIEALSDYYYMHDESFSGIVIEEKNQAQFDSIKDWAIDYHKRYNGK
ncbi:MAG: hypothetical protein LBF22_14485 [Deltaproteobacteria bacterium]|jgi:hypothetical protein|nr:hypothetical protein [Deltaproteobacteria bacterium]